jgi:hypothetical protein
VVFVGSFVSREIFKVVVCKLEDPNDPIWVEDWNYRGVTIDASNSTWVCPEEEED